MKRILFSAALLASMAVQAQDTYTNHTMVNTTDLFGTARYVGMGGAMGALGADLSTISLNPAGIGLFRRSDVSLTAGIQRQGDSNTFDDSPSRGSFDQIGGVASFPVSDEGMKYFNVAFNYQKKADFRHTFIGDNKDTRDISLIDAVEGYDTPLSDALYEAYLIELEDGGDYEYIRDVNENEFLGRTSGGLHTFDFNISGNYDDRIYWGLTVGVDYLNYKEDVYYTEYGSNYNYDLVTWKRVHGAGVNGKFGVIFRPIEESPLRIGLTLETPTLYSLKMDATDDAQAWWNEDDNVVYDENKGQAEAWLDYHIISPWRFRAAAAYTVGSWAAFDIDYEYALYNRTRVAYGDWGYDDYYDDLASLEKDRALNQFTRQQLRGVHSLKMGAEFQLGHGFALRAGYNHYSSAFKNGAYRSLGASSTSLDVATTSHYMNTSAANILTAGLGYRWGKGYIDLAYKYRSQDGDFYAFDHVDLKPVKINLDSHQLFCTLGYKF